MKPKVVMQGVGGLAVWAIPGSKLEVMWAGPGARLLIGQPRVAGGAMTLINHPTASATYHSRKDAEAAVIAFIAAATPEQGET